MQRRRGAYARQSSGSAVRGRAARARRRRHQQATRPGGVRAHGRGMQRAAGTGYLCRVRADHRPREPIELDAARDAVMMLVSGGRSSRICRD